LIETFFEGSAKVLSIYKK